MNQDLYNLRVNRFNHAAGDRVVVEAPDAGVFQSYRVSDWLRLSGSEVLGDLKDNLDAVRRDFATNGCGECNNSCSC